MAENQRNKPSITHSFPAEKCPAAAKGCFLRPGHRSFAEKGVYYMRKGASVDWKAPQSLRDSSPVGSAFHKKRVHPLRFGRSPTAADAGIRHAEDRLAVLLRRADGHAAALAQVVLCFNLIIYTVAGFIFGLDRALYSLLTYFITFKVIDFVSEGLEQAKAALIVTSNGTALAEEIYKRLGRTVTFIKGQGLISGDKEVLYCVLTRIEIFELKKIVEEMDDRAFITILEVSEVIGEHIKSTKKIKKVHQNIKNLN